VTLTTNLEISNSYSIKSINRILVKSNKNNCVQYYVVWNNSDKSYIDEEDMNYPQLLVEFTQKNDDTNNKSHLMLQVLIEALVNLQVQLTKGKTSLVTTKCRLRELVEIGNSYLKSSHMVA
jgi:hypothetical protein